MELFWFFVQQFKVPILGLLIFGCLLAIRIFVLPVRGTGKQKNNGPGENEAPGQNLPGE